LGDLEILPIDIAGIICLLDQDWIEFDCFSCFLYLIEVLFLFEISVSQAEAMDYELLPARIKFMFDFEGLFQSAVSE
jgi:hypothetical protein